MTDAETEAYVAGEGLPTGIGIDYPAVFFDWSMAGFAWETNDAPSHDATGAYSAEVTTGPQLGQVFYRGRAEDGSGHPLDATTQTAFTVK